MKAIKNMTKDQEISYRKQRIVSLKEKLNFLLDKDRIITGTITRETKHINLALDNHNKKLAKIKDIMLRDE